MPAQVGFYWRAFQLGVVYQDKLSGIMMRLAFPVYSRTESRDELRRLHERATRVHAAVVVPLLAIFIVVAPVLIPWMFGPRWAPSVVPAQILAVAGMIAAILTGYPQVMLAVGQPQGAAAFQRRPAGRLRGLRSSLTAVVRDRRRGDRGRRRLRGEAHRGLRRDVSKSGRHPGEPDGRGPGAGLRGKRSAAGARLPAGRFLRAEGAPAALTVFVVGCAGFLAHCSVLRRLFPAVWRDLSMLVRRVLPIRLPLRSAPSAARALGAQR